MTTTRTETPTRADIQRYACINAVHAQSYENPACMRCECEWKPPAVVALRALKAREKREREGRSAR
jgi:hypothetical protein